VSRSVHQCRARLANPG